MNQRIPVLVLTVALAAVLAGCGQDGPTRESAIASFRSANPEAGDEEAACVVDGLIEVYGLEELAVQLEADPVEPQFEEAQFSTMFLCGVEGDVRDQIEDQLTDAGIASEDAPCVADALVDSLTEDDVGVLLSGEITDSFAEKFYAAADSCDALG